MKRLLLLASALAAAGCVVVPAHGPAYEPAPAEYTPPPPPPEPVASEPAPAVWYYGPHFIPEDQGGGWCYEDGAHTHDYFPDRPDAFVVERGYYTYAGPSSFTYLDGHPLPGGGWCFIVGPHVHEYYPPPRVGFVWRPGRGFYYGGEYRPQRPPPPAFWPRPHVWRREPPPPRLPTVAPPRPYRPSRPTPPPPPRPADRDRDRDRAFDRDDRGGPPPGRPPAGDRERARWERDRDRDDRFRDRDGAAPRDHDRHDDGRPARNPPPPATQPASPPPPPPSPGATSPRPGGSATDRPGHFSDHTPSAGRRDEHGTPPPGRGPRRDDGDRDERRDRDRDHDRR